MHSVCSLSAADLGLSASAWSIQVSFLRSSYFFLHFRYPFSSSISFIFHSSSYYIFSASFSPLFLLIFPFLLSLLFHSSFHSSLLTVLFLHPHVPLFILVSSSYVDSFHLLRLPLFLFVSSYCLLSSPLSSFFIHLSYSYAVSCFCLICLPFSYPSPLPAPPTFLSFDFHSLSRLLLCPSSSIPFPCRGFSFFPVSRCPEECVRVLGGM